jgi:hypothetical protein
VVERVGKAAGTWACPTVRLSNSSFIGFVVGLLLDEVARVFLVLCVCEESEIRVVIIFGNKNKPTNSSPGRELGAPRVGRLLVRLGAPAVGVEALDARSPQRQPLEPAPHSGGIVSAGENLGRPWCVRDWGLNLSSCQSKEICVRCELKSRRARGERLQKRWGFKSKSRQIFG